MGGLQREFFTVLGRELFDAKVARAGGALFKKMGSESAVLIHPNGEAGAEKQMPRLYSSTRVLAY